MLGEMLPDAASVTFATPAGPVTVTREADGLFQLDVAPRPPVPVAPHPALPPALGPGAREVLAGRCAFYLRGEITA